MTVFSHVRTRSVVGGLVLLVSMIAPSTAVAQVESGVGSSALSARYVTSKPSAFFAPVREDWVPTITMPQIAASAGRSSTNKLRNALIGAVVGGAVLGGVAFVHATHCEDCFFQGPFVAIAGGVGAVLGGLIGLAVSGGENPDVAAAGEAIHRGSVNSAATLSPHKP